jgi:hypothetical protein
MILQNCFSAMLDSFNSVRNRTGALLKANSFVFITSVDVMHCRYFWIAQVSLSGECYTFRVLVPAFPDDRPANAGYGAVLDEMR